MSTFIYRPRPKDRTGKLDLKEVLRPYAEGARARETEKPLCITCGKEKTITNDFAICWRCVKKARGGDMNEQ